MNDSNIIITNDYQYTGSTVADIPHIYGTFAFKNKHRYIGNVSFGQPHKYGTYMFTNSYYQGFFVRGKFHGIGTYEDDTNICKGSWKYGKKHGKFKLTCKLTNSTYAQLYKNGVLISEISIIYITPNALKTTEEKTPLRPEGKCIICYTLDKNCCNTACGHIVCCTECLSKCKTCPLCRTKIQSVLHIYYS